MAAPIDAGADGVAELVIARAEDGAGLNDAVEFYRVPLDSAAERMGQIAAFNGRSSLARSGVVVGDVDTSQPGPELVVAERASLRSTARVRVFGDLAATRPRLLYSLRSFPNSMTVPGPISFVLADAFAGKTYPGMEIAVGDRRGRLCVYSVERGRSLLMRCAWVFPDTPRTSALQLAAGNVLADSLDDEILVADDGTRGDGIVRVINGRTGSILQEFTAFPGPQANAIELWVGDVLPGVSGPEVIVGGGATAGSLRVFSFANGRPQLVTDIPDPFGRRAVTQSLLTIGDFLPEVPGREMAVAQTNSAVPVEVYSFGAGGAQLAASVDVSAVGAKVGAVLTVK